jgi:hypothetical protein
MANPKETIEKAYGSVPKEVLPKLDFDLWPVRPVKYFWLKWIVRKLTRRGSE